LRIDSTIKGDERSASRFDHLALQSDPQVDIEHDDGGLRELVCIIQTKESLLTLPLRTWDYRPHRGLIARSVKSAKSAKENKKTYINVYYLSAANVN
jgi:hypothetical protein